jgi:hypothetical protein
MLHDRTVNDDPQNKSARSWLVSATPLIYIFVLILTIGGTFLYGLRVNGILACPADGYVSDRYLADCNASAYSDYDHGAFWFGLEPDTRRSVAGADALFLGSSQLQFAFSTPATDDWFGARNFSYCHKCRPVLSLPSDPSDDTDHSG